MNCYLACYFATTYNSIGNVVPLLLLLMMMVAATRLGVDAREDNCS